MSNPIRILVVDDHPILRQDPSALLANEPDMLLMGETSKGATYVWHGRTWKYAPGLWHCTVP